MPWARWSGEWTPRGKAHAVSRSFASSLRRTFAPSSKHHEPDPGEGAGGRALILLEDVLVVTGDRLPSRRRLGGSLVLGGVWHCPVKLA